MGRKTIHNNIVTPEKLEMVNPENLTLLNEWKIYLKATKKSDLTIVNYDSDIKIFFCWLLDYANNKTFTDVTKKDIMFFQNYCMAELNVNSARIKRLRSAISSMSTYIENMLDDEYENFRNVVSKIEPPPHQAVRAKTVLSQNKVTDLVNTLIEQEEYQQACVLSLALASGARKSELLRFKASYFTDDNIIYGSLYKTPEKILTKGRGGGKYLYKYTLKTIVQPALDLWLKERERLGVDIDDLFVTKRNDEWQPIKIGTLNNWTKKFSKMLDEDFYWHSCRHYWTTYLSSAGIPDMVIKDIQGWDSLEMCAIYNDLDTDDKLGEYFDEQGIKSVEKKSLNDL